MDSGNASEIASVLSLIFQAEDQQAAVVPKPLGASSSRLLPSLAQGVIAIFTYVGY